MEKGEQSAMESRMDVELDLAKDDENTTVASNTLTFWTRFEGTGCWQGRLGVIFWKRTGEHLGMSKTLETYALRLGIEVYFKYGESAGVWTNGQLERILAILNFESLAHKTLHKYDWIFTVDMYVTSVSYSTCTFSGERYLGDLLDSLRKQTVQPCELVVCDDDSTDSTIELLHKFKSRAPFNVNIILKRFLQNSKIRHSREGGNP